jgi:hypothetical protein
MTPSPLSRFISPGKYLAKYRAKPAGERHEPYLELAKRLASQPDAMRLPLEETLQAQEVQFEFQVQLLPSEQMMPIEDASVEWPESESPHRTVARDRRDFDFSIQSSVTSIDQIHPETSSG